MLGCFIGCAGRSSQLFCSEGGTWSPEAGGPGTSAKHSTARTWRYRENSRDRNTGSAGPAAAARTTTTTTAATATITTTAAARPAHLEEGLLELRQDVGEQLSWPRPREVGLHAEVLRVLADDVAVPAPLGARLQQPLLPVLAQHAAERVPICTAQRSTVTACGGSQRSAAREEQGVVWAHACAPSDAGRGLPPPTLRAPRRLAA